MALNIFQTGCILALFFLAAIKVSPEDADDIPDWIIVLMVFGFFIGIAAMLFGGIWWVWS